MTKHYILTITDQAGLTLCIEAKDTDEARERAQDLLDNGSPEFLPDYFAPSEYRIEDIAENPTPDTTEHANAKSNAVMLQELEDDDEQSVPVGER